MRRSSAFLLLLLVCPSPFPRAEEAAARPLPESKAKALQELLTGAPLSERQRHNKIAKLSEILAWDPAARAKLLAEARDKARVQAVRDAREVLDKALAAAGDDAALVDRELKDADHARDAWEEIRKRGGPEAERLRSDPAARTRWVHQRGFTRGNRDDLAAAYVFCDEGFAAVPVEMARFLAAKGFSPEEGEILVLLMELKDQVVLRMAAEAKVAKPPSP